jgi:hypothetical protein
MKSVEDAVDKASSPCVTCKTKGKIYLVKRPSPGMYNGKPRFVICLMCGECGMVNVGGIPEISLPRFYAAGFTLHTITQEKWEECQNKLTRKREEIRQRWQDEAQQRRDAWTKESQERHKEYEAYLLTDAWRKKRNAVFERDKYICQACLVNRAVSAHHLTYDNLFNEPLFDLVSICKPCHDAIHEARKAKELARINGVS